MTALKCRVPVDDTVCGRDAAIGLVTVSVDLSKRPMLELSPLCPDHATGLVDEVTVRMNPEEWSVVSLAYGASGGDLR